MIIYAPLWPLGQGKIIKYSLSDREKEASLYAKRNDAEDMAKKILELLDNPEKRKQMGEYGRNRSFQLP